MAEIDLTPEQIADIKAALPTSLPPPDDDRLLETARAARATINDPAGIYAAASPDVRARALLEIDAMLLRAGVREEPETALSVAQTHYDAGFPSAALGEGERALIDDQLSRVEQLVERGYPLADQQAATKALLGDAYAATVADADTALASVFDGMPDGSKIRAESRAFALASPHALRLLSARGQYLRQYRKGRPQ